MRLQCEKDRLLTAVQIVQKATATKTTLPILTGIYLIASDGMLELQATDYEVGISITIPAEVMEPGKVVLSGKFFPEIIRKISGLIETLNEQGLTFLIVEHNVDFIMRHCDHVIVMEQGKKLTEGKPEDVRRDERVLEAYLGKRVEVEAKGTAYA